jgi:hypothetical protein
VLRLAREKGVPIRVLVTAVSSPITVEGTAATYAIRKPLYGDELRQWVLTDDNDDVHLSEAVI